jgi:hypothetical protein
MADPRFPGALASRLPGRLVNKTGFRPDFAGAENGFVPGAKLFRGGAGHETIVPPGLPAGILVLGNP